jgi:hypothetical protein
VKQIGVTEQTYYRWRNEYGGLSIDQAKRLKQLEQKKSPDLAQIYSDRGNTALAEEHSRLGN